MHGRFDAMLIMCVSNRVLSASSRSFVTPRLHRDYSNMLQASAVIQQPDTSYKMTLALWWALQNC